MNILTAIGSKIGGCLGEEIINQARYLFCFNNIVEALEDEENKLKLTQDRIKKEVQREEKNTKEIEKDVVKWLKDADDVMAHVQRLKAEIQIKESCLIGWCPNWGCRYSLSRKATEKTSVILKLQNTGNFSTVAHPKPLPGIEFSAPRDFLSFKATELASDQLIEALINENTKLVGLYGAGGVGKTTLATVVGHKLQQQQVFNEVVIATVSQNPNIIDVQTKLAESLSLELKEVTKEERAKRLYLRFTETKSKILVILDDVWNQHLDLKNEFGIPVDDNLNGCKILLTTRRKHVCGGMGCNPSIALGILEPEEGFALLKCHAGIDDHDSTLIDVSKEVAGECKGLPLAIVAVRRALRGKDVDRWNQVAHKLKNEKLNEVDDDIVDVYACLKLSYDYVKDGNAKLCFLLCSLFPEDFEIDLEELVRYGVGLGWYPGVETIEKARSLLRGMIKGLKDYSLLLEANEEGFVKMHDVVRDVAIWIGSEDWKFFNGVRLTEWPEDDGLKQCEAISLLRNKKNVFPPNGWVYPNLHILLLGNYELFSEDRFVVSDQFFEGMTTLKVVTIRGGDLSIKSLQFLTDLQVLQLIRCNVRGMAFLRKLKRLQILCLEESSLDEIPDDLADELSKLKLLDLSRSSKLRIFLTKRFPQLQEFYGRMTWEVEGTNAECLSKDFTFPQLQRYDIVIREVISYPLRRSWTKALSIKNTKATSLIIFSALYQNVQYLYLEDIQGCQNILPSIDQRGLNELNYLELSECEDLECIMDATQHVKSQSLVMLSRLATLHLFDLQKLQWIWKAPAQHVDLQNLIEVEVFECNNLTYLFSLSQAQSLLQLKRLEVQKCEKLEHIIEAKIDNNERRTNILERDEYIIALPMLKELILESLPNLTTFCSECYFPTWQAFDELTLSSCSRLTGSADEFVQAKNLQYLMVRDCEDFECIMYASSLRSLCLRYLQKLQWIWKVFAQHLDLRNLTEVEVNDCNNLTYLFSLSQAQSLVKLLVIRCERLESIIQANFEDSERRKNIFGGDKYTIVLPILEELTLDSLPNLTILSSECYFPTCQALQNLSLISCPRLTGSANEFVQAECLIVRDCEDLECIMDASQHVKSSNLVMLSSLVTLHLKDLQKLQSIWKTPAQHVDLRNLTEVEVEDCNSLTYIFSLSQARSLVQVKKLSVIRCERLEYIIQAKFEDSERRKNIFGGDECTIALPILQELTLDSLLNLTTLSSECYFPTCQALQKLTLISCPRLTVGSGDEFMQNLAENLQNLRVEKCYHLCDAIFAQLKHNLKNLEYLAIGDLGARVGFQLPDIIVDGQESKLFPSLKSLVLSHLPGREVLYKGPTHFFGCLQNINCLQVQNCDRLRHLLTPTLARNLLQLVNLSIGHCRALEQIIEEDEEEDHLPPVCFSKLKFIKVQRCPKLKHLFHISVAPSLQKLKWLIIEEIDELEEVFWHKDGAVVMDDNEIIMTKLKELELKGLPNLINCWPDGYQLTFPSLYSKTVENCPKLRTNIVEEELQTTSEEDASTMGDASEEEDASEERNINEYASTVGDASVERNINENASIVGDAIKKLDAN